MGILARLGMAALPGQRAPLQGVRDTPPAFGRQQAEQTAEVVENLVGAKVLGKVRVLRSEADLRAHDVVARARAEHSYAAGIRRT